MDDPTSSHSTAARGRRAEALRAAAHAKQEAAIAKAEAGIRTMVKDGQPIDFRALARTAGVSVNFLYNNPELRGRIEQLRHQQDTAEKPTPPPDSDNAVIRTLTAKLAAERRRRLEEVALLRQQLATAHGELLLLRRRNNATSETH